MNNQLLFLIAACLTAPLLLIPELWLAWLAIISWGAYLYSLHESVSYTSNPQHATPLVMGAGAILTVGFAFMGLLYALMAAATVLMVLALRHRLPKHFAVHDSSF